MFVKFRSDYSRAQGGFHVRYRAGIFFVVKAHRSNALLLKISNAMEQKMLSIYILDCNNVIDARDIHSGVIESPNFPDPYPHNRNCTWTIKAPKGNNVSTTFSHFQVEDPNHRGSCAYDYVELNETTRWSRVS